MKLSAKQINDIAQELEVGMKVYINRKTLEYKTVLDWDEMLDSGYWEEEIEQIENDWDDCMVLTKPESREAFQIMEDFIEEVGDKRLKENLIKILNRKSPFANFKAEIESSAYRQNWFDFRTKRFEDYVKEQLDFERVGYE